MFINDMYETVCIDFYSEETVNNQGLECLRFLNEVISDFDAVSTSLIIMNYKFNLMYLFFSFWNNRAIKISLKSKLSAPLTWRPAD